MNEQIHGAKFGHVRRRCPEEQICESRPACNLAIDSSGNYEPFAVEPRWGGHNHGRMFGRPPCAPGACSRPPVVDPYHWGHLRTRKAVVRNQSIVKRIVSPPAAILVAKGGIIDRDEAGHHSGRCGSWCWKCIIDSTRADVRVGSENVSYICLRERVTSPFLRGLALE